MEAKMNFKTRNNSNPKGKPKVYFACHKDDFERTFNRISEQILQKQNCAIYYYSQYNDIMEDELKNNILEMQLVVIPVTSKFLMEENIAYNIVFKAALENKIPILPIMQERNLEKVFNEKCGDIQYLDEFTLDPTVISYDEKLEKFLDSVLISDELAEKIRNAFDAYIFLSYRKKDRKYAQELMKLIHKNDFCRDIAIWYDEFLVPGENFNDAIADALKKSKLFALVVTPNLINEENYVMTTEYPMAKERKMHILPAESVETDREELKAKFTDIPDCTDVHDEKKLSDAMLRAIKSLAIESNDNSPEHNFFIGLAYLSGIDVEVDRKRALNLIKSAAEAGLIEAKEKLVSMYENGLGVKRDYYEALEWQYSVAEYYYDEYINSPSQLSLENVISTEYKLAYLFMDAEMLDEAEERFMSMLNFSEEFMQYDDVQANIYKAEAFNGLFQVCSGKKEYTKAKKHIECVVDIIENNINCETVKKVPYYINAGLACYFVQNASKANEYYKKAIEYLSEIQDKDIDYLIYETRIYINLGTLMFSIKEYDLSIENYENALQFSEKANNLTNNMYFEDILDIYCSLCSVYMSMRELKKAHDVLKLCFDKAYKEFKCISHISCKANIQTLIGQLYRKKSEYELSEKHYVKALNLYEQYNCMEVKPFEYDIALIHNDIGVLKMEVNCFNEAITHYEIAGQKFESALKNEKNAEKSKLL